VPTIEVLLEVNQVNCNLLDKLKVELTLVEFELFFRHFMQLVIFQHMRHKRVMLVPLFLYDLKYNFPYLIDYFIGVITPKVFRVLQKRRRCVDGRYDES